jgi:hypothetical protein
MSCYSKHLDKFYKKEDIPWVNLIWNAYYPNGEVPQTTKDKGSFWWRGILKLVDLFKGIASCKVGAEPQCYSGLMSGMITFYSSSSPDYSPMQRTKTSQWHNFC